MKKVAITAQEAWEVALIQEGGTDRVSHILRFSDDELDNSWDWLSCCICSFCPLKLYHERTSGYINFITPIRYWSGNLINNVGFNFWQTWELDFRIYHASFQCFCGGIRCTLILVCFFLYNSKAHRFYLKIFWIVCHVRWVKILSRITLLKKNVLSSEWMWPIHTWWKFIIKQCVWFHFSKDLYFAMIVQSSTYPNCFSSVVGRSAIYRLKGSVTSTKSWGRPVLRSFFLFILFAPITSKVPLVSMFLTNRPILLQIIALSSLYISPCFYIV